MSNEQNEHELPDELKAIEGALAGLTLAAGAIDRDRVMYLAGQASALRESAAAGNQISADTGIASGTRRHVRFAWPLALAASLMISLGLGGRLLYLEGRGQRITVVQAGSGSGELPVAIDSASGRVIMPEAIGFQSPASGVNYMQLRNTVLSHGVEALPGQANGRPSVQGPRIPSLRDNFWGS
jgi:hypothetical protein